MQYSFNKVNETFPKTSSRTKRNLKKMHLGDFAETLVSIHLPIGTFDTEFEGELLDAMYEHDNNIYICGNFKVTNILINVKSSVFSADYIMKYCEDLLYVLTKIEPQFAEIGNIIVEYGDAYYGEW